MTDPLLWVGGYGKGTRPCEKREETGGPKGRPRSAEKEVLRKGLGSDPIHRRTSPGSVVSSGTEYQRPNRFKQVQEPDPSVDKTQGDKNTTGRTTNRVPSGSYL